MFITSLVNRLMDCQAFTFDVKLFCWSFLVLCLNLYYLYKVCSKHFSLTVFVTVLCKQMLDKYSAVKCLCCAYEKSNPKWWRLTAHLHQGSRSELSLKLKRFLGLTKVHQSPLKCWNRTEMTKRSAAVINSLLLISTAASLFSWLGAVASCSRKLTVHIHVGACR